MILGAPLKSTIYLDICRSILIDVDGPSAFARALKHMNIRPILDRILVEPIEESDVSPGGIIMVKHEPEKPNEGLVLAVGEGRYDVKAQRIVPLVIKAGDRVLYDGQFKGTPIMHEGKKLLMMKQEDLLGVRES
jgi:chaperonin GroES